MLGEISGKFRDMILLPEKVKLKTVRGTCLAVYALRCCTSSSYSPAGDVREVQGRRVLRQIIIIDAVEKAVRLASR